MDSAASPEPVTEQLPTSSSNNDDTNSAPTTSSATTTTPPKPALRHAEKRRTSTCRFADRVARVSIEAYRKHVVRDWSDGPLAPTCLATIVARVDKAQIDPSTATTNNADNQSPERSDAHLFVIGLGVGTKFLSEATLQTLDQQNEQYGDRVRDCHAEVLARRAFRRFLSLEILGDLQRDVDSAVVEPSDPFAPGILERVPVDNAYPCPTRYRLRPNVTVHFYSSSCPCGNATLKRFATLRKEVFRSDVTADEWPNDSHPPMLPAHSIHLGQVALLLKKDQQANTRNADAGDDTHDSEPKSKVQCVERGVHSTQPTAAALHSRMSAREAKWPANMSTDWCPPGTTIVWSRQGSIHTCSDKLARWNVLGLQGSLLASCVSDKVMMSTLTVGRKFSGATCCRAVCCRVANDERSATDTVKGKRGSKGMTTTSSPWSTNHPSVMGTGVYLNEGAVETSNPTGQDVRFHSTICYAWWPGLPIAEGIDGATGYAVDPDDDEYDAEATDATIKKARRRSLISSSALTELFLQIQEVTVEKPTTAQSVASLVELRRLKLQVSADYEQQKTHLLTNHPTFKFWTRRCP